MCNPLINHVTKVAVDIGCDYVAIAICKSNACMIVCVSVCVRVHMHT